MCYIFHPHTHCSITAFIKLTFDRQQRVSPVNRTGLIAFSACLDALQATSALCGHHYSFIVAFRS